MRNFARGAVVENIGGDTLRIILKSPTGEKVYHDLMPDEAQAIREAIPAALSAAETPSIKRRSAAKEN